jgi:hypothetical protein
MLFYYYMKIKLKLKLMKNGKLLPYKVFRFIFGVQLHKDKHMIQ